MKEAIKALENIIMAKSKSLNGNSNAEDIAVFMELIRVGTILKTNKVMYQNEFGIILNDLKSQKQQPLVAGTTSADEKKQNLEMIKCTTLLASEQLRDLENESVALQLYFLVANGSEEKTFADFHAIGNVFISAAAHFSR